MWVNENTVLEKWHFLVVLQITLNKVTYLTLLNVSNWVQNGFP